MNTHEYTAKKLMSSYDLPVPKGVLIKDMMEVNEVLSEFPSGPWVVKAQVYSGGRGKAGGVKVVSTVTELEEAMQDLLGSHLVTSQSGKEGLLISSLWVEKAQSIDKELYLSASIDRDCSHPRIVFMVSMDGGVDVESNDASQMHRIAIDPLTGYSDYHSHAFLPLMDNVQVRALSDIMKTCYRMMLDLDLTLLEINPLVITTEGRMLCIDGKMTVDDNALYRQSELHGYDDLTQYDSKEKAASENELSYVAMGGNIGCMVNGAGLAMATMDILKTSGGEAANFLDVGGGITLNHVTEGFRIILSDTNVKAIFVNIFGGIVSCDVIARGILAAMVSVDIKVPVVVRLIGNHASEGLELLHESNDLVHVEKDFATAAKLAVAYAAGEDI